MSEKDKTTGSNHSLKVLAIIFLWIFALYAVLLVLKDSDKASESSRLSFSHGKIYNGTCRSPECITLAHHLHNWRDISVDPCQDFYKAACGKYTEESIVNKGRLTKKFHIVARLVQDYLLKNLPSDSKSENAMKLYYNKCEEDKLLNATEISISNNKEALRMIQDIGIWPILENDWKESDFDLNEMLSNIAERGTTFFGIFFMNPVFDQFLYIGQGGTIPSFSPDLIEQLFLNILKENGIEPNLESIRSDIRDIIKLNNDLSRIKSVSTGSLSLSQLQQNVPSVDFERIIKSYLNPNKKEQIWDLIKNKINVEKSSYFTNTTENLETILVRTPKRTLANYLVLHFMIILADVTPQLATGVKMNNCATKIVFKFPLASIRIFIRNHFDKENIQIASDMVEEIKDSFMETFEESTWLHESTKLRAKNKVKMVKKVIGYPEELEAPGALDKFYESLDLSENDSYFTTRAKVTKFNIEHKFDVLASLLPMNPDVSYLAGGAEYEPLKNSLFLYPGILDDPFLDSTYPKYAKIASIGGVIGHEIGHGFDTNHRKYDENGEINDWWAPEDSAEYDRRAQCLIDQYSDYDDPDFGRNLNGSTTSGEIAADIIGINVSWKTYKKVDLSREPSIFGFEDENPDKLFFHISALNWCAGRDHTPLIQQLTAMHPTHSFRVNGIFSNTKQFAKAFNCPVGSPMNPEKKCELF